MRPKWAWKIKWPLFYHIFFKWPHFFLSPKWAGNEPQNIPLGRVGKWVLLLNNFFRSFKWALLQVSRITISRDRLFPLQFVSSLSKSSINKKASLLSILRWRQSDQIGWFCDQIGYKPKSGHCNCIFFSSEWPVFLQIPPEIEQDLYNAWSLWFSYCFNCSRLPN